MPKFSFKGFDIGSSVALSVAQGPATAAQALTNWAGTQGTVSITTETTSVITAPASVFVEATGHNGLADFEESGVVYDGAQHEYTHIWSLNGSPLSAYSAPQNMIAEWNNPNIAYGKRAAFCLTEPGTYQIDLWVVDKNGKTAIASASVVVQDPNDVYSGTDTICMALDGNFNAKPDGAQEVTSLSVLRSEIESRSNPCRVLFKRGETYVSPDLVSRNGRLTHVGTWGTGPDPIFDLNPNGTDGIRYRNNNADTQATIQGIDFRGEWNAANETGNPGSPLDWITATTAKTFILHKCSFSGASLAIYHTGSGSIDHDLLIADCIMTNWSGYGLLADNGLVGKIGVIGSRFAQRTDALHGGDKSLGWHNQNSPIRVEDFGLFYVAACDFYARTGWAGVSLDNPCLRINSTGNLGVNVILERLVCEGGRRAIHMTGETSFVSDNPGNYVIDKALLIASARTHGALVYTDFGGLSMRNVVGIWPNVPQYDGNGRNFLIDTESSNDQNGNTDEPIRIYNNTLLSMIDGTRDAGSTVSAIMNPVTNFTNVTEENNLIHAPNGTTAITTYAPIDTTTAISDVALRYPGVRFNYENETGTFASTVSGSGGTFTIAYATLTRVDLHNNGSSTPTDQTYWLGLGPEDTDHRIRVEGSVYKNRDAEFSITFGATEVTITNTSGTDWPAGSEWIMRLDRHSYLDTDLPMLTAYANPATVPFPRPLTGSLAIDVSLGGLQAYDDFNAVPRFVNPTRGAIRAL